MIPKGLFGILDVFVTIPKGLFGIFEAFIAVPEGLFGIENCLRGQFTTKFLLGRNVVSKKNTNFAPSTPQVNEYRRNW